MLEIKNVYKGYDGKEVLKDVIQKSLNKTNT